MYGSTFGCCSSCGYLESGGRNICMNVGIILLILDILMHSSAKVAKSCTLI